VRIGGSTRTIKALHHDSMLGPQHFGDRSFCRLIQCRRPFDRLEHADQDLLRVIAGTMSWNSTLQAYTCPVRPATACSGLADQGFQPFDIALVARSAVSETPSSQGLADVEQPSSRCGDNCRTITPRVASHLHEPLGVQHAHRLPQGARETANSAARFSFDEAGTPGG